MKRTFEEIGRKINKNSKGFSLLELVVVIAVMMALVLVVTGSFTLIYKSRAKSTAERFGAFLSQSKVNSLSGISNELEFYCDGEKGSYICRLKNSSGGEYKSSEIGASRIDVKVNGNSLQDGEKLVISFSRSTGAVEKIMLGENSLLAYVSNTVTFSMSRTYTVTLYTLTGEHEIA